MVACSVDGCEAHATARGWCDVHYGRWYRHGSMDARKRPNGEALIYLNEVALLHDSDDCLLWPFVRSSNGYAHLTIDGKTLLAHRLVCEAANGAPQGRRNFAAHGCGNGHLGCVNRRHLRWATPKENQADRKLHGTDVKGVNHPSARLSEDDVREIRRAVPACSQKQLAARFGVHKATIQGVVSGRYWSHVDAAP